MDKQHKELSENQAKKNITDTNAGKTPIELKDSSKSFQTQIKFSKKTAFPEHFLKPIQMKKNTTGLPDNLKSGIESLSGQSMDDVKVHYNTAIPAQLESHVYSEGTNIHINPGQEKHLPHEAWHIVQQKEGRVKNTLPAKVELNINNDKGLENEADMMGTKALQMKSDPKKSSQ